MRGDEENLQDAWTLTYDAWDPDQQPLREALCTLGNGYFATRGAAEEASAGGPHYPGTYLAGGFNRRESEVAGRIVENEDLVNWPNWLCLSFRIEDEEWFDIDSCVLLDFRQSLDLRHGILSRRARVRHPDGRETTLDSQRLVHMADPHLAAIRWTLRAENWSGLIEIRSALDGTVSNQGVERYRDLNSQHLDVLAVDHVGEDGICLVARTNQSRLRAAVAARTLVFVNDERASLERKTHLDEQIAEQRLLLDCQRERPLRVEKVVALYTSRDFAISEPLLAARESIGRAGSFAELCESHSRGWDRLWNRADIELGDQSRRAQLILRLHIFHLLQTTSFNSVDLDVGVPARGLHGEAYRGHLFWDELFIFPFLNLRIPELARSLLMYRYRRLPEARHLAGEAGYRGAMYPWQSGSDGREESQVVHLNPKSGRWNPDNTHRQRHVNAAIAYNVWQYYQATDDMVFLSSHGAEMLCELARFWASIASLNTNRGRYEIHDVVGPDEFHTQYPDGDGSGINNNAYTNIMAAWVLRTARRATDSLPEERRAELIEGLRISDEEFSRWDDVSRNLYVPFHGDGVIISQFEGYEGLAEFDWDGYREKYGDIQRLDRILEAEGDTPNRYKASKQADVLMLFYLFSSEELGDLFTWMGYPFDPEMIPNSIRYYSARMSHGSTLSRVVHSWVLARADRERAWDLFCEALESDVTDIQGGTTSEGIHLGAMAGSVDIVQRCYTGLEIRDDALWLNPCLPEQLREIRLRLRYRGRWLRLRATHDKLCVSFERGWSGSLPIGFRRTVYSLVEGEEKTFDL